jgi:oxygen-dependent protoporphyrinogen oxidase
VGEVVRRRLGAEVTTRLAGPLIGGIHAGSIETMSAAAVFPVLLEADRRGGSLMRALGATLPLAGGVGPLPGVSAPVFLSVRGGFGRLVETLVGALRERKVDLRRATPVRTLGRVGDDGHNRGWRIGTDGAEVDVDGVVMALPGRPAGRLLRPHDASLADTLDSVRYSSVAIITMRFDSDVIGQLLDGTGFLVARSEGHRADPLVTACTWLSSKWPELRRDGEVLLRASVGRDGDERWQSLDDDELVTRCVAELGEMMGVRRPPDEALVSRWPEAFAQYDVGHLDRVDTIETAAGRLPSLALAGAALHGVGIPACIGSGRQAARSVLAAGAR